MVMMQGAILMTKDFESTEKGNDQQKFSILWKFKGQIQRFVTEHKQSSSSHLKHSINRLTLFL